MSAATIRDRMTKFAGLAVLGRPVVQPTPEPTPEPEAPAPDAIWQCRATAEDYCAKLRELVAARDEMDKAVQFERSAGSMDFAGMVQRGEPLPDLTDITGNRASAELRTRALKSLVDRLAESANNAVHAVHCDALDKVRTARELALAFVREALPAVYTPKASEMAAELSSPAKEALHALEAVRNHRKPSFLVTADLFGYKTGSFRTEPLPARPGIPVRDGLEAAAVACDIEDTLALHFQALRFVLAVQADPVSARWQS